MTAKGKAPKVWIAARKGRSRLLTFPRGDTPQGVRHKARKGIYWSFWRMVFVWDQNGHPLMPCTEKRARLLLDRGRARVHLMVPFVIRVIDLKAENCEFQALRVKLDPGSKTTGIALVRKTENNGVAVINLFERVHRGKQISEALTARRGHRRMRRSQKCNQAKGVLPIEVLLAKQAQKLKQILAQAKRPLKDAAAVNATRWALVNALKMTGLVVETASGGQTKFNRKQFHIPKTHALDAACVGELASITGWQKPTLYIKAMGRGCYQRTRLDKYGCVRGYLTRLKSIESFQTGDLVTTVVTQGKKTGSYTGRVAVRASGNFNIQTDSGLVQGVAHRYCTVVQRGDGYGYSLVGK